MYKKGLALLLLMAILGLGGCGQGKNQTPGESLQTPKQQVSLNLSVAASLTDAIQEVGKKYQSHRPYIELVYNFGSSGSLQQQIEQGAPADLFISAALTQMNTLESKGLLLENSRTDMLKNKMVLVVPNQSSISSFADLTGEKVKKIAIGVPESVPAGKYAQDVFIKLGIADQVTAKVVTAKDVREVLAYVETENVDAGMVYETDARISSKVKIAATAPDNSHTPIIYPVAVIKDSKNQEAAKDMIKYLMGSEAETVFKKYGFTPVN